MEFIKAHGKELYCGDIPILLRGFGLGGWLLPEGYMWKLHNKCDRPRRMETMIAALCGEDYARSFWPRYYDGYITKEDIRFIASQGYNSVRLPLNARHLCTFENGEAKLTAETLAYVDACIDWCRTYGVYVILDMHGAPGGQTGQNIDDSENDEPALFMNPRYRAQLIFLWRKLAQRYADEPVIAGYDLLNEPLPAWWSQYNDMLAPLYEELIGVIREVDGRHLIILEGAHWDTDFSVFDNWTPPENEKNLMLQFHKYWSPPEAEGLQDYLDARERFDMPLFMGEGGENNPQWYTAAFPLYEKLNISWSFWAYKKMDNGNSPVSFPFPEGWQRLIAYLDGKETLSAQEAVVVFDRFLDAIRKVTIHEDVLRSLKREAPISIPCEFYDAYQIKTRRPNGAKLRMSEPVDIQFANGKSGVPDYRRYGGEPQPDEENLVVILRNDEWVSYDFTVKDAGDYDILISMPEGGTVELRCAGYVQRVQAGCSSMNGLMGICLQSGAHTVTVCGVEDRNVIDTVMIRHCLASCAFQRTYARRPVPERH